MARTYLRLPFQPCCSLFEQQRYYNSMTSSSLRLCGLLLLITFALHAASAAAPAAVDVSDLEGVQHNDKGFPFVTTKDGQRWVILGGEGGGNRFFLNEATKSILYDDPRKVAPLNPTKEDEVQGVQRDGEAGSYFIEHEGVKWTVHAHVDEKEGTSRVFFHNTESKFTTWKDPREPEVTAEEPLVVNTPVRPKVAPKPPMSATDKLRVSIIATVPVLVFIIGLGARIYYLHTHHPELLFPTKERKDRRRASGGKFKPQKARGKMNQDGKGGRSANS